jgi:hypothetical protein
MRRTMWALAGVGPSSQEYEEEGAPSTQGLRRRGLIRGQADPSRWHRYRSVRGSSVSAEQVALIPKCAECLAVWRSDDEERWLAYLDTDGELVFYCSECAEREFGD